jgi:hypothetical protein
VLRLLLLIVQELLLIVTSCIRLLLVGRAYLAESIASEIVMNPVEVVHDKHLLRIRRRT